MIELASRVNESRESAIFYVNIQFHLAHSAAPILYRNHVSDICRL